MDQSHQAATIMSDILGEPFVLADHPVLDMLNTQAIVEGQVTDFWRSDADQLLAPLAEQAGELIATGDFTLVRQCEHSECILWFYDRTKSHRRRWCSMALCGNRHKVAEHRKRLREG